MDIKLCRKPDHINWQRHTEEGFVVLGDQTYKSLWFEAELRKLVELVRKEKARQTEQ